MSRKNSTAAAITITALCSLLFTIRPSSSQDAHRDRTGSIAGQNIMNHLEKLESFKTRYPPDKQREVADYIYTFLKHYKTLNVSLQSYTEENAEWANVVVHCTGKKNPGAVYIFGAHYDSISRDPEVMAPGADDNASGVAVLLELARVLEQTECSNTVMLVFFSGEEQGHRGSRQFARELASRPVTVKGMINIDTIGYANPGMFTRPIDWNTKNFREKSFYVLKEAYRRSRYFVQTGFQNPDQILLASGTARDADLLGYVCSALQKAKIKVKKRIGHDCG